MGEINCNDWLRNEKRKSKPNGEKEKFNERILYELYKEYPFNSSGELRKLLLRNYGVYVSTNLIADITNYQVRKYGQRKSNGRNVVRIYNGKRKSFHRRKKESERASRSIQAKKSTEC